MTLVTSTASGPLNFLIYEMSPHPTPPPVPRVAPSCALAGVASLSEQRAKPSLEGAAEGALGRGVEGEAEN